MYNSSHLNPDDIRAYKTILDQLRLGALTPNQKLAMAQAMEIRASELRQEVAGINQAAKNDIV